MRRNSTNGLGAFHPIIFFLLVYGISLFLALFVCRSVYYSMNGDVAEKNDREPVEIQTASIAYK